MQFRHTDSLPVPFRRTSKTACPLASMTRPENRDASLTERATIVCREGPRVLLVSRAPQHSCEESVILIYAVITRHISPFRPFH